MSNTDFIDEDLLQPREAPNARKGRGAPPEEEEIYEIPSSGTMPNRPVADLNIGRMSRHKEEVDQQVARASEELEKLRKRQEDLEREKRLLQEMRSKQESFENGRHEMIEQLGKALLALERDEIKNEQTLNLMSSTRKRFKEMLGEIETLDASTWDDEHLRDELARALSILENLSLEYKKSVAKIQAVNEREQKGSESSSIPTEITPSFALPKAQGFLQYSMIGLAFSLPIIITLVILALISFILQGQGLI